MKHEKSFPYVYLNIGGLSSNYSMLKMMVDEIHPLLIFLSETHIVDPGAFEQYSLKGYNTVSCSHSRHTGGVSMYIHNSVQFKVLLNEAKEGNWFLAISILKNTTKARYGLSPSSSPSRFLLILEEWLEQFLEYDKINIVMGDFNINWMNASESRHLQRITEGLGIRQIVNLPTRITRSSRTLIDHMYTNNYSVSTCINNNLKIHQIMKQFNGQSMKNIPILIRVKCWKNYSPKILNRMVSEGIQENVANINNKCIRLTTVLENSMSQLVQEKTINTNCSANGTQLNWPSRNINETNTITNFSKQTRILIEQFMKQLENCIVEL